MEVHIFSLVMDIFFAFTLHILYTGILRNRFSNKWIILLVWLCCLVAWNSCSYLCAEYPLINGMCSLIINFLVVYILYEGGVRGKILLTFLVLLLGFISEVIIVFAMNLCGLQIKGADTEYRSEYVYIGSAASKILCFIFIRIIALFSKKERKVKIGFVEWLNILLVPVGSLIMIYAVEKNDNFIINIEKIIFFGVICIINIVTYYLYQKIQENAYELMNQKLLQQQNAFYKARYDDVEKQWQNFRRTRHNMRNKCILELEYLENQKYDELKESYIKTLGELKKSDSVINTGNIGIDSIINYKAMQAEDVGIKLVSHVILIGDVGISNGDLNVLLGNLFDNAIEATLKLDKEKRKIGYKIKGDSTALLFEITNNYDGRLERNNNGEIITTKEDKENHGIGLKDVKEIVKKYYGTIAIETLDDTFSVKVFLYYP